MSDQHKRFGVAPHMATPSMVQSLMDQVDLQRSRAAAAEWERDWLRNELDGAYYVIRRCAEAGSRAAIEAITVIGWGDGR